MDSTLGKILASIVGLIALAAVVVYGVTGFEGSRTTSAVSDVATLATQVRATYANNPAGYASLTNQVAVTAGDVPADMLQGSSIVSAWGQAVTLAPVAGQPKDFAIDLGAVPQAACVKLLTTDGNLMGASVAGKQLALPVDPATAAKDCAATSSSGGVAMSVQYGQAVVPTLPPCATLTQSFALPGTYTVSMPGGCETLDYQVAGAAGGPPGEGPDVGGAGALVQGSVKESLGATVTVVVGQGGAGGSNIYNAGSGGGFSAVSDSSGYIAIAGGGGGAGSWGGSEYGGSGGAGGQVGSNGSPGCAPETAGLGATQSAPGAGATLGYLCGGDGPGANGMGMVGAPATAGQYGNGGGGGGGSGFFGGGSGSTGGSYEGGGGGGGGSSYASMTSTSVVFVTGGGASGVQAGTTYGANGSVTLSFGP